VTRWRAGAISEGEVLRVEVAMLEARQEVTRSRQAVEEARAALAFLLGARGRVPGFRLDPHLPLFAVPPALAGADTDALVRRALAHRPDLSSARSRRDRASAALSAAERRRFPDVVLSVQGNGQGTGQQAITPPTLTFNLALVPPLLYAYRGEIEGARAELRSEELTVARTEATVLQEVATAATGFRHARERIEVSQSTLLDRARRARDLVLLQYRKGAASLVEYLDAERTFIAESGSHLRNLADYWIAVFALEGALAEDLRR